MTENVDRSSTLFLFDVDGTLAESGQVIKKDMKDMLNELKKKGYHIAVAGGGKLSRVIVQLDGVGLNHYFTECGCVYHIPSKKNDIIDSITTEDEVTNIYTKSLRNHEMYSSINILIKECLHFLSQVDYTLTGSFIDLRDGIVYISLIGMIATQEERNVFKELDKKHNYRSQLINRLNQKTLELNVNNKINIYEGGEVGIAIFPSEFDKQQVVQHVNKDYDTIHYFGDKYLDNGNDRLLLNHDDVIGHPINSPEETLSVLQSIQRLTS